MFLGLLLPLCLSIFSTVTAQSSGALSDIGSWSLIAESKAVCIHTALLPNNRLLCVERPHAGVYPENELTNGQSTVEIDLNNGQVSVVPLGNNPFCAGHAQMADGNILFMGGEQMVQIAGRTVKEDGRKGRRIYQACEVGGNCPLQNKWQQDTDMTTERWYPTVTALRDGTFIVVGGSALNLDFNNLSIANNNPTYEYYPPKETGTWPAKLDVLDITYPYNLYPPVFLLPNNKLFIFSANKTVLLDPETEAVDSSIPELVVDDHSPWIYPYTPVSVMLPLTRENNYQPTILMCGGSRFTPSIRDLPNASNKCVKINLGDPQPRWVPEDPMPVEKVMPDSAILPDGRIFFCNGAKYGVAGGASGEAYSASNPSFEAAIYDPRKPAGQRWTAVAPASVPRLYHSGALLIPDGRVVTMGSEMQNYVDVQQNRTECYPYPNGQACTSPFEYRIEAYSPPYLFRNTTANIEKPIIASAPPTLTYGSTFTLSTTTDARKVDFVSFVRYGTSTHSMDMDQRLVELKIVGYNATTMVLEAPANGALAPPGNWMLFLVRDGVPSVAATVRLGNGAKTTSPLPANNEEPRVRASSSGSTSGGMSARPVVAVVLGLMVGLAGFVLIL
ncbi:hypothetical protein HK102_008841 [Quaeritorhiza haematococci]|nr:hypothetical protein HK102_008841 [Quaeritorhiza haematococci]